MLEASPPVGATATGRRMGGTTAYVVALVASVFAILSQYFLPQSVPALDPVYGSFFGDLFVVYGVPILAFALLVGSRPLAGFVENTGRAVVQGLAWYGVLSLVALVVLIGLTIVYLAVDPSALSQLTKETPVIQNAKSDPWFWVVFSFIIGLVEELIFRGWVFGYWLVRSPNRWVAHATWTSALFAGVHLYYGQTYGSVAPLVIPPLFFLGFAFAAAVRASGGNLIVVGILHGVNDAVAFYSLVNPNSAVAIHYLIVLLGGAIGLALYLRGRPAPAPAGPWSGSGAPPYGVPADPYRLLPPPDWVPPPPTPAPPPPPVGPPPG